MGGAYRALARQRRSVRALSTTLTLLKAMAAPATTGLSMPNAANGMPYVLYTNAQNRPCLILP